MELKTYYDFALDDYRFLIELKQVVDDIISSYNKEAHP